MGLSRDLVWTNRNIFFGDSIHRGKQRGKDLWSKCNGLISQFWGVTYLAFFTSKIHHSRIAYSQMITSLFCRYFWYIVQPCAWSLTQACQSQFGDSRPILFWCTFLDQLHLWARSRLPFGRVLPTGSQLGWSHQKRFTSHLDVHKTALNSLKIHSGCFQAHPLTAHFL